MSDIVISATGLGKKYRLYDSPQHRFIEALHPFRKKYHHDFWALQDISFEVRKGECLGIMGKNGSGKSTLLQLLCGVLQPTTGHLSLKGKVAALLELGAGFNPELTGRENVYMNGSIMGFTHQEMHKRIQAIIDFADIGEFIDQPVRTYSSGMFVRLAFAAAINVDPDILIVDEALAVGDIFFRQKCYRRFEELRNNGVTVMLVSHSANDIEQLCSRALLLDRGSMLCLEEAPKAVKRYYLLIQGDQELAPCPDSQGTEIADRPPASYASSTGGAFSWPQDDVFTEISPGASVSNGWAVCTRVAVCDDAENACRHFEQGQRALFFYEFHLLHDIEVPIGGMLMVNDRNIIVHGKTTLEYDTDVPDTAPAGSILRFRQEVSLSVATGEYSFEVGLATLLRADYQRRAQLTWQELSGIITRICSVPSAGTFTVGLRQREFSVQLLHHGLCDMPGTCSIAAVPPGPF
ncbi:MAG: ABC transporter ATP-binding protein [Nitrospiraceae bacterium]|nr:ABC transporter ATP-binding protein [Nitrospiraceae bacterium]